MTGLVLIIESSRQSALGQLSPVNTRPQVIGAFDNLNRPPTRLFWGIDANVTLGPVPDLPAGNNLVNTPVGVSDLARVLTPGDPVYIEGGLAKWCYDNPAPIVRSARSKIRRRMQIRNQRAPKSQRAANQTCTFYPYAAWRGLKTGKTEQSYFRSGKAILGVDESAQQQLRPQRFRVLHIGDRSSQTWKVYMLFSTGFIEFPGFPSSLGVSNLPYAVAGGESATYPVSPATNVRWGTINVTGAKFRPVNDSAPDTNPTLTPFCWNGPAVVSATTKQNGGSLGTCNSVNSSWTATY
jgi:hypothetical protein